MCDKLLVAQALLQEWADCMTNLYSKMRDCWLPRDQALYNRLREHPALRWRSPQQRLVEFADKPGETEQLGPLPLRHHRPLAMQEQGGQP